jgi:hypothetical protein
MASYWQKFRDYAEGHDVLSLINGAWGKIKELEAVPPGASTFGELGGAALDNANLASELDSKINRGLATAADDFLVASGVGVFVKKTLAEVKTLLGLGTAAYTASTDYAVAAKGVTNGDGHDHNGGDGAQIAYSTLGSIPSTFAPSSHGSAAHSEAYLLSSAFSGLAKISVGMSAPGSPDVGDLWIDTN